MKWDLGPTTAKNWILPTARISLEGIFSPPLESLGENLFHSTLIVQPFDTLKRELSDDVLDFWPKNLWANKCFLFKPISLRWLHRSRRLVFIAYSCADLKEHTSHSSENKLGSWTKKVQLLDINVTETWGLSNSGKNIDLDRRNLINLWHSHCPV